MAQPVAFRYRAFLSYSHRDTPWAKWLHAALERYRIDRDLAGRPTPVGPVPKTLAPIFRDREDFSAGHSLTEQTEAALESAHFMVVLCSPNAARSQYVNEEIRRFKGLGRGDRVIPLIIDGEPGDPERDCFPPALRFKVASDGTVTDEREEPIAADARPQGDGKTIAKIKLIAGLLGVGFDEVVRRAERARKRRLRAIAAVVAGFVFLAVTATASVVYAFNKVVESDETLDVAVASAARIVSEVRAKADRLGASVDMQMTMLGFANDTLEGLIKHGRDTPLLRHRHALMLISFAENYYKLGETTQALARVEEARSELTMLGAQAAGPRGVQRDLAMADLLAGDILADRGVLADALSRFQDAVMRLDRLAADGSAARLDWQLDLARALEKLGNVLADRGSAAQALAHYQRAHALALELAAREPKNVDAQQFVAVALQRIGSAREAQGSLAAALASYRDSLALRTRLAAADPDNTRWQRELITLYRQIGNTLLGSGSLADASANYDQAVAAATRLVTSDRKNAVWARELATSQFGQGDVRKAERRFDEALLAYRTGFAAVDTLATADPRNMLLQRDLSLWYDRIGAVLEAQGQRQPAYDSYVKSLAVTQRIAATDPSNAVWQRDLALADGQVADRLAANGQGAQGLESYRLALAVFTPLLAADPDNSQLQRDRASLLTRMGALMHTEKKPDEALTLYDTGAGIVARLAAADPDNLLVAQDLWDVRANIGELLYETGMTAEGVASYRVALAIAQRLAAAAPDKAQWQINLALTYLNLGLRGDDTPAHLRAAIDILRTLKQAGKLSPGQESLLATIEGMAAKLPPP